MAVYVDAAIHRWRGDLWCHVFSPDPEALHALMGSIGARRSWFQEPGRTPGVRWPHYDAPRRRRAAAVAAGAVELDRHQTIVMARIVVAAWTGEPCDPLGRHRELRSPALPRLEAWLDRLPCATSRHSPALSL